MVFAGSTLTRLIQEFVALAMLMSLMSPFAWGRFLTEELIGPLMSLIDDLPVL